MLAAEVLRVKRGDDRLNRPAAPEAYTITDRERMELELAGRIEAWNDSVAAAAAAAAGLLDWTKTDADGNKWGVSPGKLHLGKITLPLPFGFAPNPWQMERARDRARIDAEIRTQAEEFEARQNLKDRAEAILELRRRGADSTRARPDTTKGGGGGPR
ncbi:MAG: hypothetical protein D6701_11335 [Gemmatimonadetes bacterium]|nr:MAG: hypothetical protein D6701_11335 [Gemmatimonadota bacterium]